MNQTGPLMEPQVTGAQSVERALALLSLVGRHGDGGASLSQIVGASRLNKPTARRLLMALMRARLIDQDQSSRKYTLGSELYVLGVLAGRRHGLLAQSMDALRRLSEVSGDTSFLTVRQGSYALCLHRQEGSHPVRTHALQAGDQHPLGVGAGAMAILAALPEAERDAIIEQMIPEYAAVGSYSADQVRQDVQATIAAGHALNPGRFVPSSWGIGRAIHLPDGEVVGAISIAAVDSRLGPARQEELAVLLAREGAAIEARLEKIFAPQRSTEEGRK